MIVHRGAGTEGFADPAPEFRLVLSDLYSFGKMLEYLLLDYTRYPAFQAALLAEDRAQLLATALWCGQEDPSDRPAKLGDVFTELGHVVGGLPLSLKLATFGFQAKVMIEDADAKRDQAEQAKMWQVIATAGCLFMPKAAFGEVPLMHTLADSAASSNSSSSSSSCTGSWRSNDPYFSFMTDQEPVAAFESASSNTCCSGMSSASSNEALCLPTEDEFQATASSSRRCSSRASTWVSSLLNGEESDAAATASAQSRCCSASSTCSVNSSSNSIRSDSTGCSSGSGSRLCPHLPTDEAFNAAIYYVTPTPSSSSDSSSGASSTCSASSTNLLMRPEVLEFLEAGSCCCCSGSSSDMMIFPTDDEFEAAMATVPSSHDYCYSASTSTSSASISISRASQGSNVSGGSANGSSYASSITLPSDDEFERAMAPSVATLPCNLVALRWGPMLAVS